MRRRPFIQRELFRLTSAAPQYFQCGRFRLALARPLVMGIVNVTPDSFSDGGRYDSTEAAVEHAKRLIADGADILDIGGESTRPGSQPVELDEERARVMPVLKELVSGQVPVSIDTQKPDLMAEALAAGASMINDVNAFLNPGALEVVAASGCAICVMHKQGEPRDMQSAPKYRDVVDEVSVFLDNRVAALRAAGVHAGRIAIDPGFGFGKSLEHNLELLRRLRCLGDSGAVVVAGISRKSMLGRITGREVNDRLAASVAAALIAVQNGAQIVRVHDVAATRDVLAVWQAVKQ